MPPAMWKLNPKSHKIRMMIKIVQSIYAPNPRVVRLSPVFGSSAHDSFIEYC
jgi:hypothetical protein